MSKAALALVAVVIGNVEPVSAQKPEMYGFLVRLGADTLAIERVERTSSRIVGDIVVRTPRTGVIHYEGELDARHQLVRLAVTTRSASGPVTESRQSVFELGKDSTMVRIPLRDSSVVLRVAAPRPSLPFIAASFGLHEQATRYLRHSGRDTVVFSFVPQGAPEPVRNRVIRIGRDSALIEYFGEAFYRARIDRTGALIGVDGRYTTNKVAVARIEAPDVLRIARGFAERDSMGRGVGALSPRDTVRATVGQVTVMIDYGRPAKRGRMIFGGLEPWGSVWRTGANAATQMRIDGPLHVGTADVPAGTYSLWTLLSPTTPLLIINTQHGQWGTRYDPAHDLVRIPLRVTRSVTPLERFSIRVDTTAASARLTLAWDDYVFDLPIGATGGASRP
jgi:hypothetical protein